LKERLVALGYPEAILDFDYDHAFPVRGLWFDTQVTKAAISMGLASRSKKNHQCLYV
jgi:hypothetical protein